jgi:hypothetical protein
MEKTNPLVDQKNRELARIAEAVTRIPDMAPPEMLLKSIMDKVQPKQMGLFQRLWRNFRTPMMSITVTPLRFAAFVVIIAVMGIISWTMMFDRFRHDQVDVAMEIQSEKKVPVVFALNMPQVSRVDVIGSFNGWSPKDYHMYWDLNRHVWLLTVLLQPGTHEYAFLIDGESVLPDPDALVYREDGFGHKNSILIINRDKTNGNYI